ncbi:hypothetical protein [Acinetobacter stercoris]|uniref:DUF3887 domain-containing protein n=1 Tax=Acinetobacter stercoris TaxID=2126983 RepID=A0A2U3N2Z9_9GAMM|nr:MULTISPECIES: hypothetical protein [Acinetobacter]SPL71985.1 hypothetical protein KPC_3163 [Acinetobacter stercoris]
MKKILTVLICGFLLGACGNSAQKQAEESQKAEKLLQQQENAAQMTYNALQSNNLDQIKKYTTAHCYELIHAKPDVLKQMQELIPKQDFKEKILIARTASDTQDMKNKQNLVLGYEYKYEGKSIIYFVEFNTKDDFSKVDDIKIQEKLS